MKYREMLYRPKELGLEPLGPAVRPILEEEEESEASREEQARNQTWTDGKTHQLSLHTRREGGREMIIYEWDVLIAAAL